MLSAETPAASLEAEVDRYAARIADTPAARADIRSILEQARIAPAATLPDSMRDAYLRLFAAAGLAMGDASGRPGAEQDRSRSDRDRERGPERAGRCERRHARPRR
ncbi:hypothetical protein ACRAVF_00040 [Bradyrhizobium oligotrophicum S58]